VPKVFRNFARQFLTLNGVGGMPFLQGVLAEQVHPVNSSPLSVSPLTWSHSAFVWTGLQYIGKFNSLKNNNGV